MVAEQTQIMTGLAAAVAAVRQAAGNKLARENVMKQAANRRDLRLPIPFPGVTMTTTVDDDAPTRQVRLQKFGSNSRQLFGAIISGSGG